MPDEAETDRAGAVANRVGDQFADDQRGGVLEILQTPCGRRTGGRVPTAADSGLDARRCPGGDLGRAERAGAHEDPGRVVTRRVPRVALRRGGVQLLQGPARLCQGGALALHAHIDVVVAALALAAGVTAVSRAEVSHQRHEPCRRKRVAVLVLTNAKGDRPASPPHPHRPRQEDRHE
ncbi:hypothetical protein GCM10023335_56790 [Streptomyces siamensis]|uniref:Uncharacterized protein n=1 Tax=Streptomyces siamensis TaxID=1274986 RepID=A0ABP9J9Y9_9ACTN